jgi:methyl-accepting chemotaxis protein
MFVAEEERGGAAYRELWNGLNQGEFRAGEFRRVAKGGVEIWIHGSYNPVLDAQGKPVRVVKFASDITAAKRLSADHGGQVAAIGRSQAVIAFTLEGIIEEANDNFLETLGYELSEIKGRHHSIFVDPVDRESAGYADFWRRLGAGEFFSAEFKRVARDGREVWIQASYNPILDPAGRPVRVVKFATDVTAAKLQSADNAGQLAAISKSQAVIEFELDGTIRTANANFTDAVGYRLQDIQGRHHRMFVDPAEREGDAYRAFWAALAAGEYQAGEYRRLGADGREIWLQASYNPILGLDGRPMKVVKYATDITAQVAVASARSPFGP